MELLAVLLITAVVFAVAVPDISAALAGVRINTAVRELVTDIRYAQQMALAECRVYRITFNTGMQLYRISYAGRATQVIVKQAYFPEELTLLGTNFGGNTLGFNIMGAPTEAGTIELMDKWGRSVRITVLPATGRVRVYR